MDFYLYGDTWESAHDNVIVKGRVPIEQMNEEVKGMQAGLRLNTMDGFSEILAKSVLWGQYPISAIAYPHIDTFTNKHELVTKLNELAYKTGPNKEGRDFYRGVINMYPWNSKI